MDSNIADKLTELLNDPKGMERIKSLASSLFTEQSSPPPAEKEKQTDSSFMPDIDPIMLMNLLSTFKNSENDSRTSLLLALKPHLSEHRQAKVDSAIKLLRLIPLLPLVKQLM